MEELLVIYCTVSELTYHCFKQCDFGNSGPFMDKNSVNCVQTCVENCMYSKRYVNERWETEEAEIRKSNKRLDYTSVADIP